MSSIKCKVFCRINASDIPSERTVIEWDNSQIYVKPLGVTFTFDQIIKPECNDNDIYKITAEELLNKFLDGNNVCLIAYGQTGSGKTYTMGTDFGDRGIILDTLNKYFEKISMRKQANFNCSWETTITFIELHNEKIYDLISNSYESHPSEHKIIENDDKTIEIKGITSIVINECEEAIKLLQYGLTKRKIGIHDLNTRSSRSHAIYTIHLTKKEDNTLIKSKFNFVDLAGSERIKKTKNDIDGFREGVKINTGLLALSNVINALSSDKQNLHIPYRSSKLTRLLQDSLGGNSCTSMIACINPSRNNLGETCNTMRYATRVKKIKNKPIVNEMLNNVSPSNLKNKIIQLTKELINFKNGKAYQVLNDKIHKLETQIEYLANCKSKSIYENTQTSAISISNNANCEQDVVNDNYNVNMLNVNKSINKSLIDDAINKASNIIMNTEVEQFFWDALKNNIQDDNKLINSTIEKNNQNGITQSAETLDTNITEVKDKMTLNSISTAAVNNTADIISEERDILLTKRDDAIKKKRKYELALQQLKKNFSTHNLNTSMPRLLGIDDDNSNNVNNNNIYTPYDQFSQHNLNLSINFDTACIDFNEAQDIHILNVIKDYINANLIRQINNEELQRIYSQKTETELELSKMMENNERNNDHDELMIHLAELTALENEKNEIRINEKNNEKDLKENSEKLIMILKQDSLKAAQATIALLINEHIMNRKLKTSLNEVTKQNMRLQYQLKASYKEIKNLQLNFIHKMLDCELKHTEDKLFLLKSKLLNNINTVQFKHNEQLKYNNENRCKRANSLPPVIKYFTDDIRADSNYYENFLKNLYLKKRKIKRIEEFENMEEIIEDTLQISLNDISNKKKMNSRLSIQQSEIDRKSLNVSENINIVDQTNICMPISENITLKLIEIYGEEGKTNILITNDYIIMGIDNNLSIINKSTNNFIWKYTLSTVDTIIVIKQLDNSTVIAATKYSLNIILINDTISIKEIVLDNIIYTIDCFKTKYILVSYENRGIYIYELILNDIKLFCNISITDDQILALNYIEIDDISTETVNQKFNKNIFNGIVCGTNTGVLKLWNAGWTLLPTSNILSEIEHIITIKLTKFFYIVVVCKNDNRLRIWEYLTNNLAYIRNECFILPETSPIIGITTNNKYLVCCTINSIYIWPVNKDIYLQKTENRELKSAIAAISINILDELIISTQNKLYLYNIETLKI